MFEPGSVFSMYANRQQNIEDFINLLATDEYADDADRQAQLCERCGMSPHLLSPDERRYIEKEVNKRRGW